METIHNYSYVKEFAYLFAHIGGYDVKKALIKAYIRLFNIGVDEIARIINRPESCIEQALLDKNYSLDGIDELLFYDVCNYEDDMMFQINQSFIIYNFSYHFFPDINPVLNKYSPNHKIAIINLAYDLFNINRYGDLDVTKYLLTSKVKYDEINEQDWLKIKDVLMEISDEELWIELLNR